jgi:hypothetical protein
MKKKEATAFFQARPESSETWCRNSPCPPQYQAFSVMVHFQKVVHVRFKLDGSIGLCDTDPVLNILMTKIRSFGGD